MIKVIFVHAVDKEGIHSLTEAILNEKLSYLEIGKTRTIYKSGYAITVCRMNDSVTLDFFMQGSEYPCAMSTVSL